jgi:hypothetical protein
VSDRVTPSRSSLIYQWWNGARWPPGNRDPGPLDLRDTFVTVLLHISTEHLERFLRVTPTVVCLQDCLAQVAYQLDPTESPEPHTRRVITIYFNIDLTRQTRDALQPLVAHEVAHIVLGHLDHPRKPRQQCEAEVAAQLQAWGFPEPECYATIAPEMRLLNLATYLQNVMSRLREAAADSARSGTAVWAASQLESAVSDLREVLRPGQLARLCAFLRDLPCESVSVGTGESRPIDPALASPARIPRTPFRIPPTPL